MLANLRKKLALFLAPELELRVLIGEHEVDRKVNLRFAKAIAEIDPMELVLKRYNGVFTKEYQRPEESLNTQGEFQMKMWGWQQHHDPYFKHLMAWIANTQGNEVVKRARTNEQIFFGRAIVSTTLLVLDEVERLSSLYEEIRDRGKDNFTSNSTVE